MTDTDTIRDIVRSILSERFENIDIVSINIDRDVDEDGAPILLVKVVFDGKKKQLDAKKASGLVRRILPKLAEADERGFPVLSFIEKSDLGKLAPETV